MIVLRACYLASAVLCAGAEFSGPGVGSLKGIKWKQELPPRNGEYHDKVYGRLVRPRVSTGGAFIDFSKITTNLKNKDVQAVAFRIDVESRFIDEDGDGSSADEMANYHQEVATVIEQLDSKGIQSFLFTRIWLDRNSNDDVFDRFNTFLSSVSSSIRDKIAGIALTETHLSDMSEIRKRCKWIPTKFEKAYPGWLQQRAFIMPGMELGFRFTGAMDVDDGFHTDMAGLVGQFAFSVKSMKEKSKDDPDGIYADFPEFIEGDSRSLEERASYMREHMGLGELIKFQASSSDPAMGQIVYWGDSGDAMTNVHPLAAQALHQVLNAELSETSLPDHGYRGTFFYAPAADKDMNEDPAEPNLERTIAKSIMWYDRAADTLTRHELAYGKWEGVMGVFDQWDRWSQDDPQYGLVGTLSTV